mmetsp:Transcript_76020/g.139010  ORF Transcript_76020/g.139010 Transcript_76020/m.139010 type:complete len:223 (-) Transcript_76020:165-833(-)
MVRIPQFGGGQQGKFRFLLQKWQQGNSRSFQWWHGDSDNGKIWNQVLHMRGWWALLIRTEDCHHCEGFADSNTFAISDAFTLPISDNVAYAFSISNNLAFAFANVNNASSTVPACCPPPTPPQQQKPPPTPPQQQKPPPPPPEQQPSPPSPQQPTSCKEAGGVPRILVPRGRRNDAGEQRRRSLEPLNSMVNSDNGQEEIISNGQIIPDDGHEVIMTSWSQR